MQDSDALAAVKESLAVLKWMVAANLGLTALIVGKTCGWLG